MPINYLKQIQLGEFNAQGYRINPSQEIASVVEGFYVFSGDPENDTHLIFNDGFPVVIFLQDEADRITVTAENDSFEIRSAWASAGSIKNVYIKYHHQTSPVFIVRFYPGAFYQLFDLDSQFFRARPILSFEILSEKRFSIKDFFNQHTVDQKILFIEAFIQKFLAKIETPEMLNKTLDYIRKTKGPLTVYHVSTNIGVNYKWLERSFSKHIGLLPKEYLQLQRFMHAYQGLIENRAVNLIGTAISNGYYDYNHYLKDFKAYTGKTPLTYLRFQEYI